MSCAAYNCTREACAVIKAKSGRPNSFEVCADDYMRVKNGEAITMRIGNGMLRGYAAGQTEAV